MNQETIWSLCILCQSKNSDTLVDPGKRTRKDQDGYKTLAENLTELNELDALPFAGNNRPKKCFFSDKGTNTDCHEAATLNFDNNVRQMATELQDSNL